MKFHSAYFEKSAIDGKPQNPVKVVDTDANSSILGFTSSPTVTATAEASEAAEAVSASMEGLLLVRYNVGFKSISNDGNDKNTQICRMIYVRFYGRRGNLR